MSDSSAGGTAAVADEQPSMDSFSLVGSVLDRKFKIERCVAEGGFGVVYFGTHLTLEKPIAVKVLKTPPEFNDQARAAFIEKFALEAKTIARVSHPNIVQVLDFGVSTVPTGHVAPWMVLEWLTGQTLEQLLEVRRGRGDRDMNEAYGLLRPVVEALAYAHEEGIAHRDIKPANMMMVQSKRGQMLRLLDFGIAKLMDDGETAGSGATRTRTTMNAFSPMYAAPEQIGGARTGPWTDVHALALIFTEVLTDRAPYDGDDLTTLYGQVLSPQRPTPAARGRDVGALEPVLRKALALKPDERFRNAGEFLMALEEAMPNVPRQGVLTGRYSLVTGPPADASGGTKQAQFAPTAIATGDTGPQPTTTMRGAAVSGDLEGVRKSNTGIIVAIVVALAAVVGVGGFLLFGRSSSTRSPQATTSGAAANAPSAAATGGSQAAVPGPTAVQLPPDPPTTGATNPTTGTTAPTNPTTGATAVPTPPIAPTAPVAPPATGTAVVAARGSSGTSASTGSRGSRGTRGGTRGGAHTTGAAPAGGSGAIPLE